MLVRLGLGLGLGIVKLRLSEVGSVFPDSDLNTCKKESHRERHAAKVAGKGSRTGDTKRHQNLYGKHPQQ